MVNKTALDGKLELILPILCLIFGIGLSAGMVWLEKRPREGFKVSIVPTTPLMFVGALIAIVSVAYLLSVLGIHLPDRGF